MASVGHDNSLRIWNIDEMKVVNIIEDKVSKKDNDNKINSLAW
jgi:hypothetical protein